MKLRLFRQVLALTLSFQLVSGPVWAQNNATQTPPGNQPEAQLAAFPENAPAVAGQYGRYINIVKACESATKVTKDTCRSAENTASAAAHIFGSQAANGAKSGAVTQTVTVADRNYTQFNDVITAAGGMCTKAFGEQCTVKCDVKLLPPANIGLIPEEGQHRAKAVEEMTEDMADCTKKKDELVTKITDTKLSIASGKKGLGDIWKYVAGAAVIGGGYMLLKGKGKDKEAEEKAKTDAANGVIKDSSGNDLACFTPENFTRSECKSTLISMCQGEKADTSGCRSFEAAYCANEGSGSNYCLYAETKVYCAQSGDGISKSPACTWKSSRPSSCLTSPEDVGCLASGTAEALTLSCANYPNDPLCAANSAGRVVVQGGSSTTTTPVATTSKVGASSMSSVIGTSSARTPASSLQVISSSDNMWSSSSAAVKNACATGALVNCM